MATTPFQKAAAIARKEMEYARERAYGKQKEAADLQKGWDETRKELMRLLSQGIVHLTFIKASDGSVRDMNATLAPKFIPDKDRFNKPQVTSELNRLLVYDLDLNAWRSFYVENLITFTYNDDQLELNI